MEEDVISHPLTKQILDKYKESSIIQIKHYKDVFCRSNQDFEIQKKVKNLIIARKNNNLIYKGAPVCQSFGNEHFYYTSSMMNCIYDCEYCYLQGMYPSANVVVFVNIEDIFEEVKSLLKQHPLYLCVSYDTDLASFEHLTGYTKKWIEFTKECNLKDEYNTLKIEIRTKSAHTNLWKSIKASPEVILAYTMSPDVVISQYEHGTPGLSQRINSINTALDEGYKVRLCFDPIIYCSNFEEEYDIFFNTIFENIDMSLIEDISIGTFRISQDYLKNIRKNRVDSAVVNFPYVNVKGVYQYPEHIMDKTMDFVYKKLLKTISKDKIFIWR